MRVKTITISDKGQINIPREFVKHLGTKIIKLEAGDNQEVRIIPIEDLAGSLTDFVEKNTPIDFAEIRSHGRDKNKENFDKKYPL